MTLTASSICKRVFDKHSARHFDIMRKAGASRFSARRPPTAFAVFGGGRGCAVGATDAL
jgi:hypothetical protein